MTAVKLPVSLNSPASLSARHKEPPELTVAVSSGELSVWRRHPDLNRGMMVLQTTALPLGYVALSEKTTKVGLRGKYMERAKGLEPSTSTLARWRSTR